MNCAVCGGSDFRPAAYKTKSAGTLPALACATCDTLHLAKLVAEALEASRSATTVPAPPLRLVIK